MKADIFYEKNTFNSKKLKKLLMGNNFNALDKNWLKVFCGKLSSVISRFNSYTLDLYFLPHIPSHNALLAGFPIVIIPTTLSNNINWGKDSWKGKSKNYSKVIGDNEDFTPELINTIFENFINSMWI